MDMSYTVDPDCRGVMTIKAPNGKVTWQSNFVLVNGGREGMYMLVVPHQGVGIGTFRRIDQSDQQVENQLDDIAAEIDAIRETISKIAQVMGLAPN